MKKIIDGKRYDTSTAELIHEWHNGQYPNDFKRREKNLYLTKKGAWFLHHIGGALTDMSVSCGGTSRAGSEDIEPITEDNAYEFLESHGGENVIEEYFPDRVQDA